MKSDVLSRVGTFVTIFAFATGITNFRELASVTGWLPAVGVALGVLLVLQFSGREPRLDGTEQSQPEPPKLSAQKGNRAAEFIAWSLATIVLVDLTFGRSVTFSRTTASISFTASGSTAANITSAVTSLLLALFIMPWAIDIVVNALEDLDSCGIAGCGFFVIAGIAVFILALPALFRVWIGNPNQNFAPPRDAFLGQLAGPLVAVWTSAVRKTWDARGWEFFELEDTPVPWAVAVFLLKSLFFAAPLVPVLMLGHSLAKIVAVVLAIFYYFAFQRGAPRF